MASDTIAAAAAPTLVERAQTFVADNKRAILIGSAALVVGGALYYATSSSSSARRPGKGTDDVEKGEKSKRRKSKKKKTVKDDDGPILEEIKPEERAESDPDSLTAEQLAAMPKDARKTLAEKFKERGNKFFKAHNYRRAAELYTKAMEASPKEEAIFYNNRAACYSALKEWELVIQDSDAALRLDPSYVKVYHRRGTTYEKLDRYDDAVKDYTAASILGGFKSPEHAQSLERVVKVIAERKAADIMTTREPRLPPYPFIAAYFAAFRDKPRVLPPSDTEPTTGDATLQLALDAFGAGDYAHVATLVNEALEQGISASDAKAEALNLRGTFRFLTGDSVGAKEDLLESVQVDQRATQSYVKLASVEMELGNAEKAFECFDQAISQNPEDPDIYYHRGQVFFIMERYDDAIENYVQSRDLDPSFVFSHIQLAVAQYKAGRLGAARETFRDTMKQFPQKSEPYNYYGELLMDQQSHEEAVEKFDRAIELGKLKRTPNVVPLVNKGLALFQWRQDLGAAERCCNEALRIDPECDAAIATLAQLSLQQGRLDKAIEWFQKHVEIARSMPELVGILTYQYATQAQLDFIRANPQMAAQLAPMARSL